jgi:hypothetical protein
MDVRSRQPLAARKKKRQRGSALRGIASPMSTPLRRGRAPPAGSETPTRGQILPDSDPSTIITLNVGGTKYTTTLATLRSQPGSRLATMFSGGPDADGQQVRRCRCDHCRWCWHRHHWRWLYAQSQSQSPAPALPRCRAAAAAVARFMENSHASCRCQHRTQMGRTSSTATERPSAMCSTTCGTGHSLGLALTR